MQLATNELLDCVATWQDAPCLHAPCPLACCDRRRPMPKDRVGARVPSTGRSIASTLDRHALALLLGFARQSSKMSNVLLLAAANLETSKSVVAAQLKGFNGCKVYFYTSSFSHLRHRSG